MPLLHGPRICGMTSTSVTVWARYAAFSQLKLQVRAYGSSDEWTTSGTQLFPADTDSCATYSVDGLSPATKYEYRMYNTATQVVEFSVPECYFWTYPSGDGTFVVYQISDAHGSNIFDMCDMVQQDYEANYEPLGIGALILQIGDLWASGATGTIADAEEMGASHAYDAVQLASVASRRMPFAMMFDDWDWAGNNTNSERTQNYTSHNSTEPHILWNRLTKWGGMDLNISSTAHHAFVITVCNVPFIFMDQRSQKKHLSADLTTRVVPDAYILGNEFDLNGEYTWLGKTQFDWLKSKLRTYQDYDQIYLISGGTFADSEGTIPILGGNARDTAPVYYKAEQAALLREFAARPHAWRRNITVLSGDDHYPFVLQYLPRDSYPAAQWHREVEAGNFYEPADTIKLPITEFKSSMAGGGTGVLPADYARWLVWYTSATKNTAVRHVVTTANQGKSVWARVTYLNMTDGSILASGDDVPGDWFYRHGTLVPWVDQVAEWSAPAGSVPGRPELKTFTEPPVGLGLENQSYPGNNVRTDRTRQPAFERTYEDDVNGTLHPYRDVERDPDTQGLRHKDDIDEEGRDEMDRYHRHRVERDMPSP